VDRCPDQPGPKENQGCPWPDRDGDGVLDKDDRCPDQPGPKENQGCPWPDRDGDGVPDKDDDCPDQPGPASNKGCPVKAKVVVTKTEVKILERVNFATGSARITRDSYAILNAVAQVLKEIPALTKLEVQGHTDDTASRRFNLKLSQRRANAVKGFLVKRGIEGNRLVPKGYGPDVPLVKVDKRRMSRKQLREARYQNRRVQFLILERSEER
jgi:outer membrane protein OmpA-like peptidoglycan-associated protein